MKMTKLAIASVLKREELNLSSKLEEVEFFSFYRCYASYVIFIFSKLTLRPASNKASHAS
ncbi:hypothetical protein [Butyrivibrio proteoclasticus]|uniref:hypothetical protein n=1 Tax=Butyrivibrio proteoclasticus TaxID=43305 RepID=UPI001A98DDCB|nr:hypothetical protein [Butyrivibrio proteoclasticus]